MTLTRMIPSLRAILPDPLLPDSWPEATVATTTDVVVSGISLLRLVEVCGTPCVHSGASVLPRTGGRPSTTSTTGVLVARVTRIERDTSGRIAVETDARLHDLVLVWSETRLIGRASTAHSAAMRLGGHPVELPDDLRAGDLLAIPSAPVAALATPDWLSSLE